MLFERRSMFTSNMQDYEETNRTFRLEIPDHYNFGSDTVDGWAQDPKKLGLFWVGDDGS